VVEVARNLTLQMYAPGEVIVQKRTIFALEKGVAWRKMQRITKGHVWGSDMILSADELRDQASAICLTVTEIRFQEYSTFEGILESHPADKKRVRNYCVKLAVVRGAIAYARQVREAEKDLCKARRKSQQKDSPQNGRAQKDSKRERHVSL
jgi:hypothetical protein